MRLDGQLDAAGRVRVANERAKALENLRVAIERTPAADVRTIAGMPSVREARARALLAGLEVEVLAA